MKRDQIFMIFFILNHNDRYLPRKKVIFLCNFDEKIPDFYDFES